MLGGKLGTKPPTDCPTDLLLAQVYYVTMDLSHSGMFEKVKNNFHTSTRGGHRQWFNPVYADPNKDTRLRPTKTNAMLFAEDGDEDDLVPRDDDDREEEEEQEPEEPEEHEEHEVANPNAKVNNNREHRDARGNAPEGDPNADNPIDPTLRNIGHRAPSRAPTRAPSRAPTVMPENPQQTKPTRLRNAGEIQVLDLHSDNPIISYKGRIFSGNWASNIGTELVFGAHDEVADRGLPYLRALPGGVDLMAASSARILTIPADLRPKKSLPSGGGGGGGSTPSGAAAFHQAQPFQNRRTQPDRYRALRRRAGIEIPIAHDKHGRRRPQARFLENLMAIKRRRGEMDEATTMTKDTSRDVVDPMEDPEEASMQKKRARDRRRQALQKQQRANAPKQKRRGGNRWAKKPTVSFAVEEGSSGEERRAGRGGEGDGEGLSTRTPTTWEKLGGNGGGKGEQDAEDAVMQTD